MKKNAKHLVFSLALSLGVMLLSSTFTRPTSLFYTNLVHPSWIPPGIAFAIIWPILYAMIGLSFWTVLSSPEKNKERAYFAFGVQLFCNSTWSFFFFFLQSPFLGLINILLLSLAILWNIFEFGKISKLAATLLLPYFAWILYASALNYAFWSINR